MIQDHQRYEFITSQIRYHNEKMIEAFNRFVQLFTIIVGGSIWLSLQTHTRNPPFNNYGVLAGSLVALLAFMSSLNIINDLLAWFGFRQAETALVGRNILPPPHWLRSCWMEYLMLLGMLAVCAAFWCFNPLANS